MKHERRPRAASACAAALAFAVIGCGLGPGESSEGAATLTVTRDYGSEHLRDVTFEDPAASLTVLRALDGEAEIETRYGGGFVQSIDGIEGMEDAGRSLDWFFFVNGTESSVGAADVEVEAGDRIWWDYRDWTAAMRAPAVVGSWPQPFVGEGVTVSCVGERTSCDLVEGRLGEVGAAVRSEMGSSEGGSAEGLRVLVGPWRRVREDSAAALIAEGPATSGVFAEFDEAGGGVRLFGLDERADEAFTATHGAGLVAAVRVGEDEPTWVVTGTDDKGVRAATELLTEGSLRDHYTVATDGVREWALPVVE
jgi:hypothetical protein